MLLLPLSLKKANNICRFPADGCDDGDGCDGQHELYVGRPLFKAGRTTTAAACTEHLIGNSILFLGWNQNRLPEEETKS